MRKQTFVGACEDLRIEDEVKMIIVSDAIERMNQNSKIKRDEMSKIEKERKLEK